jgi:hypothetical protein
MGIFEKLRKVESLMESPFAMLSLAYRFLDIASCPEMLQGFDQTVMVGFSFLVALFTLILLGAFFCLTSAIPALSTSPVPSYPWKRFSSHPFAASSHFRCGEAINPSFKTNVPHAPLIRLSWLRQWPASQPR